MEIKHTNSLLQRKIDEKEYLGVSWKIQNANALFDFKWLHIWNF